jgi:uncharacterized membrane protein YsdA (DUF1294 family)
MIYIPTLPVFFILNIISLLFFGVDKLRSKRGGWRISDLKLLLVALFGPFGAFAGILLFNHKTRKAKFFLVPIFLFIHSCLIVYLKLF